MDKLDKALSDHFRKITSNGYMPTKGSYKAEEDRMVTHPRVNIVREFMDVPEAKEKAFEVNVPTKLEQLLENSQSINNCSLDALNRLENIVSKLNGAGELTEGDEDIEPKGLLDRISYSQDRSNETLRKISDLVGILEELL